MKAVLSVIGKDRVGIMAMVCNVCANRNANILDISQTVMSECFTMIMLLDVSDLSSSFKEFKEEMAELGKNSNLEIAVHREEIFRACNRI